MEQETTRQLITSATVRLQKAGCDTPRLDAEVLLMHAWRIDRPQLIIRMHQSPPTAVASTFRTMIGQREDREPVAYIIGEREFWSRTFRVSPAVLIPRPETEHLIEATLDLFPDRDHHYRFCDIGTGSGCIAVTLACEFPQSSVMMTDLSEAALAVARKNAERHSVTPRIEARVGDLLSPLPREVAFDLIISNPPYVSREEIGTLAPELGFEPRGALTDEADGQRHLHALVEDASRHLRPGGFLIVETGLCGLPTTPPSMQLREQIFDLATQLRGGIYQYRP
ncbi:MAG TPA: peptide chain release factor N(5)-glutamine methyltransferase [Mariprofundaceae bacterium]|nr:peptide chain release factor N(5)-glutamine methyltransferase [Mariprofundaceae bacterium]